MKPNTHTLHTKTPLNHAKKSEFIHHINEEHQEELIMMAQASMPQPIAPKHIQLISILDIYHQGIDLNIQHNTSNQTNNLQHFIPFIQPLNHIEDLKTQYIALIQQSAKFLGKKSLKIITQNFTVINHYKITPHMLRLVLSTQQPTPLGHAGFAYLFKLTHPKSPTNPIKNPNNPNKQQCYYTLRKAWKTAPNDSLTYCWIDIYLHSNDYTFSPASLWANALKQGDTIISEREYPEKIEHLFNHNNNPKQTNKTQKNAYRTLLIADETSLPTVARLLELWTAPNPPIIIAISNDIAEQDYLTHTDIHPTLKNSLTVLPIITHQIPIIPEDNQSPQQSLYQQLANHIDNTLDHYLQNNPCQINKVWGALESSTIKALRKILKPKLNLDNENMVLKAYWRWRE